jgi:hypothetical protein
VPPSDFREFVSAVTDVLALKGIDLPRIPDSADRRAYLALLEDGGYSEDQVLPVYNSEDLKGDTLGLVFVALMQALQSDDSDILRTVAGVAVNLVSQHDNTNLIIYTVAKQLANDFRSYGIVAPGFYAGVFPTDSFNAQSRLFRGSRLVLLDTGCIEMAQAVVTSFLSQKSEAAKVDDLATAVNQYIDYRVRPDSRELAIPGVTGGMAALAEMLNAVAYFMIAHELGHLVLGHAKEDCSERYSPPNNKPEVIDKTELQEFQADIWACHALTEMRVQRSTSTADLGFGLAGPMIALGIGLTIERANKSRGIKLVGNHPSSAARLYMIQVLYRIMRVHQDAGIGIAFLKIVEHCLSAHYPQVQSPPLPTGELNRMLTSILKRLALPLETRPFLDDFN